MTDKKVRTIYEAPLPLSEIHDMADKYAIFLNSVGAEQIDKENFEYRNSYRCFMYSNPHFSGLLTTDSNGFYGEIVRTDRMNTKQKEQFLQIMKRDSVHKLFVFEQRLYLLTFPEIRGAVEYAILTKRGVK